MPRRWHGRSLVRRPRLLYWVRRGSWSANERLARGGGNGHGVVRHSPIWGVPIPLRPRHVRGMGAVPRLLSWVLG
jgi:hypothetical protein